MKKASVYLVVGLLILSLAGSVALAAPMMQNQPQTQNGWYCPYWGQQQANLTDAQKQELAAYQNQMLETKKQMLQKQVEWGWMTQAQADQYITSMSQHMVNGAMYGHGMMGGGLGMMGMNGGMGMGTRCW